MSAQELMVQSLKQSGYRQILDREGMDEDDLASKEFFVWPSKGQHILCLSGGKFGDGGKIKFYFVDGVLMGHAVLEAEDDD